MYSYAGSVAAVLLMPMSVGRLQGGQVADQLEGGPHEKQSWVQYKETSPIDHIGRAGK